MAGIPNPGDFEIEVAELISSRGLEQDLTPNIISITIYENINTTAISGQIFFSNAFALSSVGPLIGQEYLRLKIKTTSFTDTEAMVDYSENVLTITSVNNRTDDKNGIEFIVLNFVSSEQIRNERTRIDRVLRGSYSDIVINLLQNDIDCRKNLYIEPTDCMKKIVSPNMTPFDLIHLAESESISKELKSPTFMFFETLRGYHFRSLDSLYVQGSRLTYDAFSDAGLKIHRDGSAKGAVDIMAGLTAVIDWEIVSGNDSLVNNVLGTYGSKLIIHDIFNKRFTEHEYNYLESFPTEGRIEYYNSNYEYPLYSATPVDGKKTVSDFPSRPFLTPTSIKDIEAHTDATHHTSNNNHPFSAQNAQTFLQRRNSQMIQSEQGFMVNILTLGNTVISAGDVVTLDLPMPLAGSFKYLDSDADEYVNFTPDKWYKGAFLIKRIRHDFDIAAGKHHSNMVLVKDSLTEEIESSGKPEPKGGGGTVFTDFHQNLEFYA